MGGRKAQNVKRQRSWRTGATVRKLSCLRSVARSVCGNADAIRAAEHFPKVRRGANWLRLVVGLLQRWDVDFSHLQHGLADSFCFLCVLILEHLWQDFGDDLPD